MSETTATTAIEAQEGYEDEFERLVSGGESDSELNPEGQQVEQQDLGAEDQSENQGQGTEGEPEELSELEKLQKEVDYYKHAFDANRGRVSALQKKINAYEQQQAQATQVANANPTGSGMTDEKWAEFVEEYPELAQAMEARLNSVVSMAEQRANALVASRLEQLSAEVEPLKQKAHDEYVATQLSVLDQRHPGWRDTVASDSFREWIGRQPAAVQQLIHSDDVQDASFLVESFSALNGMQGEAKVAQSNANKQRLMQSVGVKRKGSTRTTGVPEDYEDAFDYFVNQS